MPAGPAKPARSDRPRRPRRPARARTAGAGDHTTLRTFPDDGPVLRLALTEMSRRSADADRGSAFAPFSAANATALAVGSVAGDAILATLGFEVAILATLGAAVAAALLAVLDPALHRRPSPSPEAAPASTG